VGKMSKIDKDIKILIKLSKNAEIKKDNADAYGYRLAEQLAEKILEKIVDEKLLNTVQWHVDYRYDSSMSRIYSRIDKSWDHIIDLYKATDKLRWGHCALQITPKIRLQFDDSHCAELLAQNFNPHDKGKNSTYHNADLQNQVLLDFIKEHGLKVGADEMIKKKAQLEENLARVNKAIDQLKNYSA
jgi:hypothetical protein